MKKLIIANWPAFALRATAGKKMNP